MFGGDTGSYADLSSLLNVHNYIVVRTTNPVDLAQAETLFLQATNAVSLTAYSKSASYISLM